MIVSCSCLESDWGTAETGPPNARRHPCSHDRKPSVGVVISIPSRRSSSTYQLIPHPSCINVLGTTDADFLVIPHHKLERKCQVLVLVKRFFDPTKEPFAERHVGLDFPSLTGKRLILNAQEGVDREWSERTHARACTTQARNG